MTRRPPTASRASRRGTDEWLVAVRMVSEGVDIPRLRVGRVRDRHDHRPVLPAGGRPVRALGARHPRPARLAVHPRRPAAARARGARSPSNAATPCGGTRDADAGRPGCATPARRRSTRVPSSCRCSRRCPRRPSPGSAGWQPWQELLPDDWDEATDGDHRGRLSPLPPPAARRPLPRWRQAGRVARPRTRCDSRTPTAHGTSRGSRVSARDHQRPAQPSRRHPEHQRRDRGAAPGAARGRGPLVRADLAAEARRRGRSS